MIRRQVRSSLIESAGYDPSSRTVEVKFVRGGVWQYYGVPADIAGGMFTASSVGRYFIENIRDSYDGKTV